MPNLRSFKIKKSLKFNWWISFVLSSLVQLFSALILSLQFKEDYYIWIILGTIVCYQLATFYFGYKKRGTKWLNFVIFGTVSQISRGLGSYSWKADFTGTHFKETLILLSLFLIPELYFIVTCYWLKTENKKLKEANTALVTQ